MMLMVNKKKNKMKFIQYYRAKKNRIKAIVSKHTNTSNDTEWNFSGWMNKWNGKRIYSTIIILEKIKLTTKDTHKETTKHPTTILTIRTLLKWIFFRFFSCSVFTFIVCFTIQAKKKPHWNSMISTTLIFRNFIQHTHISCFCTS